MRPDGKQSGTPGQFKAKWVRNLLKHLRMAQGKEALAEVWDDCPSCRYDVGRIEGVLVHAVIGRFGPPMEVGGNSPGHVPKDSVSFPAGADEIDMAPPVVYGYALAQGRREYMEDRCVSRKVKAARGSTGYMFAVFDGHGGSGAADWVSNRLWRALEVKLEEGVEPEAALRDAFLQVDEEWCEEADMLVKDDSGSTALVALVLGNQIYFASAGDGAGTVYRSDGKDPEQLSFAHKPDEPSEKKRIQALGGFVAGNDCARLQGVLAVSRGFGDLSLKQWVTAEPAIRRFDVIEGDRYLVIASDGMTDVLLPSEVGPIVAEAGNVESAAQELVDVSLAEGSSDNVGVLVVDLSSIARSDRHYQSLQMSSSGGGGDIERGDNFDSASSSGIKRSPWESSSSVRAFLRGGNGGEEEEEDQIGLVGSGR